MRISGVRMRGIKPNVPVMDACGVLVVIRWFLFFSVVGVSSLTLG